MRSKNILNSNISTTQVFTSKFPIMRKENLIICRVIKDSMKIIWFRKCVYEHGIIEKSKVAKQTYSQEIAKI